MGLGIWSVVSNVEIFTLLDESMLAGVYILIVSGAVVMLLSFLGCYGCMNDSKPAIVVVSKNELGTLLLFSNLQRKE